LQKLIASGEKINALKEEHAQEIHALEAKQELERREQECNSWHVDMRLFENAGEMVMQH
jgi:hypothetical protein